MLANVFLLDRSDPDDPKIVMVQKTDQDQGDRWALPGGRFTEEEVTDLLEVRRAIKISEEAGLVPEKIERLKGEELTILKKAAHRETEEEVGLKAAEAIFHDWIEIVEIDRDRGRYSQFVFVAPFAGKLRKKGLKEVDESGQPTERLGPPTWASLHDVSRGVVKVGMNFSEIYRSHMNAIYEALSAIADIYPELAPFAEATKPYAWDHGTD